MPTIKTYRAKSLPDAIAQIRKELGPEASLLHTREVGGGLLGRLLGRRGIEVAASAEVQAPSRFAVAERHPIQAASVSEHAGNTIPGNTPSSNSFDDAPVDAPVDVPVEEPFDAPLASATPLDAGLPLDEIDKPTGGSAGLTDAMFALFTDLIEADVAEPIARGLVDDLRRNTSTEKQDDADELRLRLRTAVEQRFTTSGPINTNAGRRLVALVGPTGVGKTTTIAKLAANFRLREGLRVGLITVDTYRVAAVDQLRTYAEIIDLPMEVVGTPREMRDAVERFAGLDLVLLDTAGRSPRDEVQLQELRSMLTEANPDEVHLVLSATAGARQLAATAERFGSVGVTSLLLTKTDEAATLGHLIALAEESRLPVSYTTNGQNVPDDIGVATPSTLTDLVLS